jgi:hypothetical protein
MAGFRSHREFADWQLAYELRPALLPVLKLDHLQEAYDCGYINKNELAALEHLTRKAIKAANGLIRYLESTPDVP